MSVAAVNSGAAVVQPQSAEALWFETLALATAYSWPAFKTAAFIAEVAAEYEFFPGSTEAANGYTVITPTSGTPGRLILKGDTLSIQSIDQGVSDDWPRLQLFMDGCVASATYKAKLRMRTSLWRCATTGVPPNGTRLYMETGVDITAALPSGAFTGFLFRRFHTTSALGVLSAAPTQGDSVISVSVAPTLGQDIWVGQITSTYLAMRYTVKAVGGAGPFNVTLDRPCMFPFANGESVRNLLTAPQDIVIDFNNAVVRGVGDRIVEFTGAYRVYVKGIRYAPNLGAFVSLGSIDIGSYECTFEDCYGDCYGVVVAGWFIECSERCSLIRCGNDGATNGVIGYDDVNCSFVDCYGSDATNCGLLLTSNLMTIGCFSMDVRGGYFNGGANLGVGIAYATDCTLTNVRAERNVINYDVGSGATPSIRTRFMGCSSARSTSRGMRINAAALDTKLIGHASLGDVYSVATFGQVAIYGSDFNNYTSGGLLIDATVGANAPVTFSGGRIASNVSGSIGCDKYGPCALVFENTRLDMNTVAANSTAIFDRAAALGSIVIRNCTGTQASACNGLFIGGGGNTGRVEGRTDFQAFAAPYTITAGSYINRFAIVLNPGAALVVAFPDLKVNEAPKFTRTAVAGGTGLAPVVAPLTPGTGFTVTAAAADGDTYQVEIGA